MLKYLKQLLSQPSGPVEISLLEAEGSFTKVRLVDADECGIVYRTLDTQEVVLLPWHRVKLIVPR